MRLDAIMLADHAVSPDGKLYINGGGITRLNVPFVPFAVPALSIVLRFLVESPEDRAAHRFEMQFQTPSGVTLFPQQPVEVPATTPHPDAAPGEEHYVQVVLGVGAVPIIETGVHTFSVRWDGELVRAFSIPVVLIGGGEPSVPPNRAERRRQQRAGQRD